MILPQVITQDQHGCEVRIRREPNEVNNNTKVVRCDITFKESNKEHRCTSKKLHVRKAKNEAFYNSFDIFSTLFSDGNLLAKTVSQSWAVDVRRHFLVLGWSIWKLLKHQSD